MSTFHVSAYGLDDPEDEEHARERFMRKLLGRRPYSFLDLRGSVIDDYREECEADEDMGREEDE